MKDLADVKLKEVSEHGNRKIANFKQEIDQQLRLVKDNRNKSEAKTKEILNGVEQFFASHIQEVKDQTECMIEEQREGMEDMNDDIRNEIQVQVNKLDHIHSEKMNLIGNQVQKLTDKLLTPFIAHNINLEVFFQVVAEKVKPIIKEFEEKRLEGYTQRQIEEIRKREDEEQHLKVLKSMNSNLIPRIENKQWLVSQLPQKAVILTLLFRGSTHGWSPKTFHELCDDKGPTITIFKTKANRVFGGFTQQSWDSESEWIKDDKAFIYSIDKKKIYRVVDAQEAIFCGSNWGPTFGGCALGLHGDPLNNEEAGYCYTNGYHDGSFYGIKSDLNGNHELTGEGQKQKDDSKRFTCS